MKDDPSAFKYNPFGELKSILKDKPISASKKPSAAVAETQAEPPERDVEFFREAMQDVSPLPDDRRITKTAKSRKPDLRGKSNDNETLRALKELVEHGTGYVVADTSEYVEGIGYEGNIAFAGKLHRGDYSIQDHIDLHGMTVEEAREEVEHFLEEAVVSGKRAVSIIHGRGLSSSAGPVLKTRVIEWISSGRWRKWVIAYASAPACDGAAGATYILLRSRPYTKRPANNPKR
jgi:DNA-nicking Smr family endonuclease